MKIRTLMFLLPCCCMVVLPLAAQTNRTTIFPDEDVLTPENLKLVWPATPGIRYEVKQSTNLQSWSTAPGYPAAANGPAQQMPFLTEGDARFFQVRELDEQPPGIVNQYPQDGGFAVPRFADLTIQLSDVTGINTDSVRLTVGSLGTFTLTNAQLTLSDGVLTFINGGSIPLGGWGSNIVATLVMADTLGYVATNTWTFTLEIQPQVVTNLFVFGSPQAQRAGQRIGNIPTAALATRSGPIPMGDGDPWTLELVESNRLVLSYTNTAPGITNNTYVCNLTPRTTDEIFYRKVTSVSDNPATKRLTLFTTNVPLAEILEEGSAALSSESVIYDVDTNNVIIRAFAYTNVLEFEPIGVNTNTTLYDQSGVTLRLKEAKFLFTPSLSLSFENRLLSLQRFNATLRGRLETALVPELTISGTLAGTKDIELFSHEVPVFLGWAGPVPVWLHFNFSVGAEIGYNLSANATMSTGARQNVDMTFGVDYVKGRSPALRPTNNVTRYPMDPVPFTFEFNGSASAYAKITPQIDVRVDSLAGMYANVSPQAEITGNAAMSGGQLTSADLCLGVSADFNVGLSVFLLGNVGELASFQLFQPQQWCTNYPSPTQLTIRRQPQSLEVVVGGSATFSVDASASQPITYQWFNNGAPMTGKTDASLTLNNVNLYHAGQYYVRLTSGGQTSNSAPATLTVVPASLQSGLVAYYPFNGNANDTSGNGNSGTVVGATLTTDRFGNATSAYYFNGSQYISVANSPSLNPTTGLTLAAWVEVNSWSTPPYPRIISKRGSEQWDFTAQNGSALHFAITIGGTHYDLTAPLPSTGVWHHLVATYDGSAIRMYYDGAIQTSQAASGNVPVTSSPVYIGALDPSISTHFASDTLVGTLDDLRIYNRALSASEILQLYNFSLPPAPAGMVLIPAGSFTMGDTYSEGNPGERPTHSVNVSAFYMDKYELTKALWDEVRAWGLTNGFTDLPVGSGKSLNHPVQMVSWYDCVKWCNARSQKKGLTPCYYNEAGLTTVYKTGTGTPYVNWNANGYRLPTEAEWERAARGGLSGHHYSWSSYGGAYSAWIDGGKANYSGSAHPYRTGGEPYTTPVGYYNGSQTPAGGNMANGYGLYDMTGNVWEWCWDWVGTYPSGAVVDPTGPASGSGRVNRGGSWLDSAFSCRVADRGDISPAGRLNFVGLRCVRGL